MHSSLSIPFSLCPFEKGTPGNRRQDTEVMYGHTGDPETQTLYKRVYRLHWFAFIAHTAQLIALAVLCDFKANYYVDVYETSTLFAANNVKTTRRGSIPLHIVEPLTLATLVVFFAMTLSAWNGREGSTPKNAPGYRMQIHDGVFYVSRQLIVTLPLMNIVVLGLVGGCQASTYVLVTLASAAIAAIIYSVESLVISEKNSMRCMWVLWLTLLPFAAVWGAIGSIYHETRSVNPGFIDAIFWTMLITQFMLPMITGAYLMWIGEMTQRPIPPNINAIYEVAMVVWIIIVPTALAWLCYAGVEQRA